MVIPEVLGTTGSWLGKEPHNTHAIIAASWFQAVIDMLRSLEVQNFIGIKQGKIEDLAEVNILVGRNNAGKATILDALIKLRSIVGRSAYLRRSGLAHAVHPRVALR